jgi:cytochrome c oxidase subunit 3
MIKTVDTAENLRNKINPKIFGLWIAMASILMMFAALTSAYIVRQGAGNWLEFQIPSAFFLSTIMILASSVSIHFALNSYKKGKVAGYKIGLVSTLILGILFVIMQYFGWLQLEEIGVYLNGNPSGSFFYVISGLHAAHVLGGLAALIVAALYAFTLSFKVTKSRLIGLQLVTHYWHFVDFLWVYLLIFLILQS